jgi:hypothetical protein
VGLADLDELHVDRAYLSSRWVRERPATLTIRCKAWPVRNGDRFPKTAFALDWQRQQLECPNHITLPFQPGGTVHRRAEIIAIALVYLARIDPHAVPAQSDAKSNRYNKLPVRGKSSCVQTRTAKPGTVYAGTEFGPKMRLFATPDYLGEILGPLFAIP